MFTYPGTPSEFPDVSRTYYGPTMNAFEAAVAAGREAELTVLLPFTTTLAVVLEQARLLRDG
jgi:hypothetical protein